MTQDFWSFCLSRLEQELPQQQFNTWIKTLRAESGEGSAWTLIAPNRFVLQWVRERYLRRIEELGEEFSGVPLAVDLQLPPAGAARPARAVQASADAPTPTATRAATGAALVAHPPVLVGTAEAAPVIATEEAPEPEPEPVPAPRIRRSAAPSSRAGEPNSGLELAYEKTRLNPDFTFDTLVTGRANKLIAGLSKYLPDRLARALLAAKAKDFRDAE